MSTPSPNGAPRGVREIPYGPGVVMVDAGDYPPHRVAAQWRRTLSGRVVDVIPAARTVLVRPGPQEALSAADRDLLWNALDHITDDADDGLTAVVELPVVYDGADLGEVAAQMSLAIDDVVALHSGAVYRVAFCGFAPGFAYLTGLDQRLQCPRRSSPRREVPAGSVAIAAEYTAVYPTASPGGWHLLGHTDRSLFDIDRDPPAVLQPGDMVRFVDVG